MHSWKSFSRENCFFFFIKIFLDQIFWKYSVFESFVVPRVKFSIKDFNWVTLRAIFSQVDKFWIEILERVRFWKKVLQRIRFWIELDFFNKKQTLMKVLLPENHFWIVLHQKTPLFAAKRFLRNQQLFKTMEKKQLSYQDFCKEFDFEASF